MVFLEFGVDNESFATTFWITMLITICSFITILLVWITHQFY